MNKRNLVLVIAIFCALTGMAQMLPNNVLQTTNPSWISSTASGTTTNCYQLLEPVKPAAAEIAHIINVSKEINLRNGITHPDSIFPSQKVTFILAPGRIRSFTVQKGQTQTELVTNILKYEAMHGPLRDFKKPNDGSDSTGSLNAGASLPNFLKDYVIPDWVITLFIVLFGLGFCALFFGPFLRVRRNVNRFNVPLAYQHNLDIIEALSSTGGTAQFEMDGLNIHVAIPTQEHVHVHITETTTIGINVTLPKEDAAPEATTEKKDETTAAADTTSTAK